MLATRLNECKVGPQNFRGGVGLESLQIRTRIAASSSSQKGGQAFEAVHHVLQVDAVMRYE